MGGKTESKIQSDGNEYFNLVQRELLLKREQLKALINQPTLLGNYYEEIIKENLIKFISKKYSLATGIIIYGDKSSNQMDIIIYDNTISYPLFSTQNMVIIEPEAVKAIIEVKSEITTNTLNRAIKNLRSGIDVYNLSQPHPLQHKIESIIIGFTSGLRLKTVQERCKVKGIDQIVIFSKRDGQFISGQLELFLNNIAHLLRYRANGLHNKTLLGESGYLEEDEHT